MANLFDTALAAERDRLRAAGWSPTLCHGTEGWLHPDGSWYVEHEALAVLRNEEQKHAQEQRQSERDRRGKPDGKPDGNPGGKPGGGQQRPDQRLGP